jgi:hypothetical protein
MAIMSLAEAKEELLKEEQEQAPPEKRETLKLPEKKELEESEEVEETTDESLEAEITSDAWMKGDEEEEADKSDEPDTAKLSDAQAAKIRRKFQGRLKAEKDESEKLREENAELQRKLEAAAKAKPALPSTAEPKREQYRTDDEFQKALTIHLLDEREKQRQVEQQALQQRQAMESHQAAITKNVESHYARRAELAKKSGIADEAMGSAEQTFRQAIDDVRPGAGDIIVDQLIDILGKGSEMVIHKLGVSRGAREKATQLLRDDPQGRYLIAYAAELKASLSAPMKRVSNAPEPPVQIQGDKTNNSAHGKLIKEYEAAQKSGDSQREWNARKALKAKGVDVSRI